MQTLNLQPVNWLGCAMRPELVQRELILAGFSAGVEHGAGCGCFCQTVESALYTGYCAGLPWSSGGMSLRSGTSNTPRSASAS